jgi:hypothetical protein
MKKMTTLAFFAFCASVAFAQQGVAARVRKIYPDTSM